MRRYHASETLEYISPDGKVYKFSDADRILLTEEGYGMPPIEYITQKGPYQHGETVIDYRLAPRTIQLLHRRDTCSRDDYWTARNDILNILRPNRQNVNTGVGIYATKGGLFMSPVGHLLKRFPDGRKRQIDVVIDQGPVFAARDVSRWDEWAYTETLRFIAHDPTWYDPTQVCHTWALTRGVDLTFPFDLPFIFGSEILAGSWTFTYNGTWLTYPVIRVAGPLNGFTITNKTTNEFIRLDYNIPGGTIVTFTLDYGNKTVRDNLSNNLIGKVTPDSDLATFCIYPEPAAPLGITEIIVYGSGANTETAVDMGYYTRYIGI